MPTQGAKQAGYGPNDAVRCRGPYPTSIEQTSLDLRWRDALGGIVRRVSLRLTPEAKEDDYVLVHAGFAIHIIDEQEAQETLKIFEQLEATEGS